MGSEAKPLLKSIPEIFRSTKLGHDLLHELSLVVVLYDSDFPLQLTVPWRSKQENRRWWQRQNAHAWEATRNVCQPWALWEELIRDVKLVSIIQVDQRYGADGAYWSPLAKRCPWLFDELLRSTLGHVWRHIERKTSQGHFWLPYVLGQGLSLL